MTSAGVKWISIPISTKGKFNQKINETKVLDNKWADQHWKSLHYNYAKAKYFPDYADRIKAIYEECKDESYLSIINYKFIQEICSILGICTKITWSSDYQLADGKTERLVQLVKDAGGSNYLSGPAAKNYIKEELFEQAGIALEWMDYSKYPEYTQLSKVFEHGVSILDLIFNEGPGAAKFLKSIK